MLYLNIKSSVLMILHYTLKNKDYLVANSYLDYNSFFGTFIFKSQVKVYFYSTFKNNRVAPKCCTTNTIQKKQFIKNKIK